MVIYVPCLFLIPRNLCNPIVPSGLSLTTVKKWGVELWDVEKGCLSVRPCRWCWPHATSHERFQTPLCQHHRRRCDVDAVVWAHLRLGFFVAAPLSSVGF